MTSPIPKPEPFTASLRTHGETIRVGAPDVPAITIRVESAEVWNAVRIAVPPGEPVLAVKLAALEALEPCARHPDDYVLKLQGVAVLNEHASVADTGARDGSIYLLSHRRRRPVR
jgi:hypothetical protein